MYSSHEDFSVAHEIDRLRKEVERTNKKSLRLPPGKLAHLGYLYLLAGDTEEAKKCFVEEQAIYPESEHFMNFLLSRVR